MNSASDNPALPRAIAAFVFVLISLSATPANAHAPVSNPTNLPGAPSPTAPSFEVGAARFRTTAFLASGQAGFSKLDPTPPAGMTPEQIVKKFGERESAFAKARDEYTFRQTVKVNTISDDTGKPDGEYQQVTDIVFSDAGARTEHVVFAPQNTLSRIMMTQADFDDIAHRLPFVLTTPELPQYDLTYLGRQKIDDIDTYVFDCKPKELVKGKRYFQGKVWVDQQEFQIVLINGKSVPDDVRRGHEDLSPPYTTYYQEVDKDNWFPVYTKADGILHFPGGQGYLAQDVRIRYVVKYEDYKRFHAKSRIIFNGETLTPDSTKQPPGATPPDGAQPAAQPKEDPNALPPPDPDAPAMKRPKQ
jgi:hypothetical protein